MAETFESICAPSAGNVSAGLMSLIRETGLDGTKLQMLGDAGVPDNLFFVRRIIALDFTTVPTFYFQAIAMTDFDSKIGPTAALVEAHLRDVLLINDSDQSWINNSPAIRTVAFQNMMGRFKRCYMLSGQIYNGDKEEPLDDMPMTNALKQGYKVKHYNKFGYNIPSSGLPRDVLMSKFDKCANVLFVHIPLNTLVSSASQESSSNGTFFSDSGTSRRIAGTTKKSITSFPQLQMLQTIYCNAFVLICVGKVTAEGKPYFDMTHKQRFDHFMQQNAEKWAKAPASFYRHINENMLSTVDFVNDSDGNKGAGDALDLALSLRQPVILAGPTLEDLIECGNTPPGSGKRFENPNAKHPNGKQFKNGKDQSKGNFPGLKTAGPNVLVGGKKACKFYCDNRTCRNSEANCKDGHFCDVMLKDANNDLKVCGEKHTRKQHIDSLGMPKY